jgi:hypothetical protein
MAKPWSVVEQSEEYQALAPEERLAAKQEYWDTVVTAKKDYNNMPPQEQLAAKTEFMGAMPSAIGAGSQTLKPLGYSKSGVAQYDPIQLAKAKRDMESQSQVTTQQAKDVGVLDVKRKTYTKDLESFFAVDDVLQEARGKGLGRITAGGKMTWEGFKQDTPLGKAVAVHDAARKRLRVQLVRAAGDVGNINIVEQKAAEMLIPTQWDDAGTAELKRSYLTQIGKAINDNDGNAVKTVLGSFMGTPVFSDAKVKYNELRAKGKSSAEAKKLLGL